MPDADSGRAPTSSPCTSAGAQWPTGLSRRPWNPRSDPSSSSPGRRDHPARELSTDARDSIARFGAPRFIANANWEDGMATSLQVGLAACDGAESVVVGLADQPCVTPHAWRAVASSPSPIAVATYGSRRGNPVRLHAALWPNLPRTGDEGARGLFRSHPELVEEVACQGSALDVDTRDDIARVEECLSSRKKHR